MLVGISTGDDAGVFRLADDLAIVNTVDFFTPVVDDPFTYGQIAAANALSDVYAMGGTPRTALNIVCWPQTGLPGEMLTDILRGAAEKAREAGVVIVGGHTVADEEVKFGMAITGVIDPRRIVRNVGARAGDALLLTKALGTGILMTAFKRDALADEPYQAAVRTMIQLNAAAAAAMLTTTSTPPPTSRASVSSVMRSRWPRAAALLWCSRNRTSRSCPECSSNAAPE